MKRLATLVIIGELFQAMPAHTCAEQATQASSIFVGSSKPQISEIPGTGDSCLATQPLDNLMRRTLSENTIPGAAVAVVVRGHLVYSRGFGYADKKNRCLVKPGSQFRIASLAKPITAATILSLCEAGKLSLDDNVLSILNQYRPIDSDNEFDTRWSDITVRHLLQHRAGWDRAKSVDPMFASVEVAEAMGCRLPAPHDATICYMLRKPLDFDPGERYCYSNFGYCLLGRVIEKITGQKYESFVNDTMLKPIGVADMRVGRTLPEFRGNNEVHYYDPGWGASVFACDRHEVPQPYGAWSLEAMDSHGGWVGSAVDLVKFAYCYYGAGKASRLREESIRDTTARPPGAAGADVNGNPATTYYGLGWQVFLNDHGKLAQLSHRGSLPGTSSLLVCRGNGVCYALLFNGRESDLTDNVCTYIEDDVRQTIEQINSWPVSVDIGCN